MSFEEIDLNNTKSGQPEDQGLRTEGSRVEEILYRNPKILSDYLGGKGGDFLKRIISCPYSVDSIIREEFRNDPLSHEFRVLCMFSNSEIVDKAKETLEKKVMAGLFAM
ncbi:MAG: hypothetical protein WC827_00130 [Candidatus Paceibacterota bacterium]|jgi:hypothetical protein